jgi:hypothetical protein
MKVRGAFLQDYYNSVVGVALGSSIMVFRRLIFSLFPLVALVLAARSASAQYNTAEVAGVVKDSQGGVLPGEIGRAHV